MRPDEHKKKKNAAYKKKHGMASNKSSDETASSVKIDKKDVRKEDRKKVQKPDPVFKEKAKNQAVPVSSDETSSDSNDVYEKTPKRKQFKRREIVSNWQKYEMEPKQDEKVKTKGEKYDVLLGMAGEAMSRFRFRDELEWEDEPSYEDANIIGEQQSYLQLNPTDLMQSLSCIPVHQLLDVDEELFPKDQLECILQIASKNQALYCPGKVTTSTENKSASLPQTQCNSKTDETILHVDSSHIEKEAKFIPSKTHSVSSYDVQQQKSELNGSSSDSSKSRDNSECVHKNLSQANPLNCKQALGLQDDDLDRLLDMDLDVKEVSVDDSCLSQSAIAEESDSLTTNCVQTVSKEDKDSENLEEWLDSILD